MSCLSIDSDSMATFPDGSAATKATLVESYHASFDKGAFIHAVKGPNQISHVYLTDSHGVAFEEGVEGGTTGLGKSQHFQQHIQQLVSERADSFSGGPGVGFLGDDTVWCPEWEWAHLYYVMHQKTSTQDVGQYVRYTASLTSSVPSATHAMGSLSSCCIHFRHPFILNNSLFCSDADGLMDTVACIGVVLVHRR